MKTDALREPLKAKRFARVDFRRRKAIDKILDDVLRERPANVSVAKLLEESRR